MSEGGAIHILIAEDDAIGRKIYKRFLDLPNLVIDFVENGMNLVASGKSKAYDLIISDYYLPDVNGLEAIHLIRADLTNQLTPVIFATGTSLPLDLRQIKTLSMSSILSKPFSKRDLLQAIRSHLRLAQIRAN